MFARRNGSAWSVLAPAKLNLCLDILGRRFDGFHELESVMTPVALYDRLEYSPGSLGTGEPFSFAALPWRRDAPLAPAGDDNLACRAVRRLADAAGIEPQGRFLLRKSIPMAAGLGGGSSDAAAALVLANAAWGLGYDRPRLAGLAAELGSDVPFFLAGGPACCRGRGEIVEPLAALPRLPVVIVKPPQGVSTPAAYAALGLARGSAPEHAERRSGSSADRLTAAWRAGAWSRFRTLVVNRLQAAAEGLCSAVDAIAAAAARLDVLAHAMTGSGSAYFAICRSANHAHRIAACFRGQRLGTVYATATCP
ncbi:MAG: 4-(cytidine 5'-diphospho)-2-C-methyl-D-erythritol kinase [Pirellulales bacterium]|nr:4-(cytidine 5'-diphospho)-2-C-methyl-D-erythritol kinase [Pirellulales bacterium]